MLARSLRSPLVRGFGAAAILVLSTVPAAVGAGATPSEADTFAAGNTGGQARTLAVGKSGAASITAPEFAIGDGKARPGDVVEGSVHVAAAPESTAEQVVVRLTGRPPSVIVEPTCFPDPDKVGYCALGDLTAAGQDVPIKVHIPNDARPGTTVQVVAQAEAADGTKITATSPEITIQEQQPTPSATLAVSFSPKKTKAGAGTNKELVVNVKATRGVADNTRLALTTKPKATLYPVCDTHDDGRCRLGTVGAAGRAVRVGVAVPASMGKGTLSVRAYAVADNSPKTDLVKASIAVSGGGTGTGGGAGTGAGSGTGTGTGAGSSTGPSGSTINPPTGLGSAPAGSAPPLPGPNANGQQPLLPEVAPPAVPAGGNVTPHTKTARLVAGGPAAQEEEFNRLASTQAAWLAALLVAFVLMLVHARMGRLRLAAMQALPPQGSGPGDGSAGGGSGGGSDTAGRTAATGSGGAHRRPKRGLFRRSKSV